MTESDAQFWSGYRSTELELRERCERLVDPPPTRTEWGDADLMGMGGVTATDEQLTAYWRLHRYVVEHDEYADFLPDLRYVTDALDKGVDPVELYQQELDEAENDEPA